MASVAGWWWIGEVDRQVAGLDPDALPTTLALVDGDGLVLDLLHGDHRLPVHLDELPDHVVDAFVAAEDRRFHLHPGVDLIAIARAAWVNLGAGGIAEGGSTITQQVAKQLVVGDARTLGRKLHEAVVAWRLERVWTKRQILEVYLNLVYLGGGAHGVEAAALELFGVPAAELDLPQAALVAGLVVAPSRLWPDDDDMGARHRRDRVLQAMVDAGFVPAADASSAMGEPVVLDPIPVPRAAAYVTEARRQLRTQLGDGVYRRGLRAELAVDLAVQQVAEAAVARVVAELEERQGLLGPVAQLEPEQWRPFLERPPGLRVGGDGFPLYPSPGECFLAVWQVDRGFLVSDLVFTLDEGEDERLVHDPREGRRRPFRDAVQAADVYRVCLVRPDVVRLDDGPWAQGAAVVLEHATGRVRALVGGVGVELDGYVRATRALRQPGSSFKSYVWAAALQGAWEAGVSDLARWSRARRLRWGLATSDNGVAQRLARRTGHAEVLALAAEMGVSTPMRDHESLALGTRELTVLDNALGYATIARGGSTVAPVLVERVVDRYGDEVALPPTRPSEQVLAPEVAAELTEALVEVVRSGTAEAAWDPERPLAGKTGTTDGPSDAWFVGFTEDHTVAVWIGSDQRVPLGPSSTGASVALPVWQEIVAAL